MAIGSLGKDPARFENICNVLFKDIAMQGGLYGARFKSWVGGNGLVRNVTWSGIKVTNVTFPVMVTQTYRDQSVTKNSKTGTTQAVEMRGISTLIIPIENSLTDFNFTWADFTGTINSKNAGDGSCITNPCWDYQDLKDIEKNEALILQCASEKSCSNFVVKGFKLKTDAGGPTTAICSNVGKVANPNNM